MIFGYWCWRVFGKVLVESGVGKALANMLQMIDLPLLPAAFIISTGAACIAGVSNRSNPDNRRVLSRSGDGIKSDSVRIGNAGSLLWWAWRVTY